MLKKSIRIDYFILLKIIKKYITLGPSDTVRFIEGTVNPVIYINWIIHIFSSTQYRDIEQEYKKEIKKKEFKRSIREYIKSKDKNNKIVDSKTLLLLFVFLNVKSKVLNLPRNKQTKKDLKEKQFYFKDLKLTTLEKEKFDIKIKNSILTKTLIRLNFIKIDYKKEGEKLLKQIRQQTPVKTWKLRRGWKWSLSGRFYTIRNNVPYLTYVNNGTSRQRAQRFIQKAIGYYNINEITNTFIKNHFTLKYKI